MNEAFAQRLQRQKERHTERDLAKSIEELAQRYNKRGKTRKREKPKRVLKAAPVPRGVHPLRALRMQLGLSQKQMALALGKPAHFQTDISAYETGRLRLSNKVLNAYAQIAEQNALVFDIASVPLYNKSTKQRKSQPLGKQPATRSVRTSKIEPTAERTISAIVRLKLPGVEQIPDYKIECHNTQLGELLVQLDDHSTALLREAHSLVAALHRDCSTHEKTKFNQALARGLGVLSHSVGQLKNCAFQIESDEPMQTILDEDLNAEAQAWKDLLAANPIVNEIHGDDPRVGELIFPILQLARIDDEIAPHLTDVIRVAIERKRDPLEPAALKRRLQEARERIEELSRLWFEQERDEFLSLVYHRVNAKRNAEIILRLSDASSPRRGINAKRNAEIIARRYGWDSRPAGTLQEVADEYYVSRERVRQICGPFEKEIDKLAARQLFAPVLDRVLASLSRYAPLAKTDAQAVLHECPDITEPLDISDLLQWANRLGRGEVLSLEEIAPGAIYLVHPAGNRQSAGEIHVARATILKVAHKAVSRWGVAQLDDIAAKATEYSFYSEFPLNFDAADIEKIVKSRLDFRWLDEEQGWFWLSNTKRNGLLTQIEKIFAVASRISIGELRGGVSRHHRREGFAPPRKVLLELCRQLPGLGIEDEEVFLDPPRDLSSKLSPSESLLWEILKKHGPVMARPNLEKLCAARSMNRVTFYSYLNSSPIIARFTNGVFGLRGAQPTPGDVETALENLGAEYSRLRRRVLKDYGWTDRSEIWLSYKLSQGILNSGNAAFPTALKPYLQGSFALTNFGGESMGTLTFGPNQAWGLRPFLRRGGAEIGDYLLLIFNLAAKEVRAALGDENLSEEFLDSTVEPSLDNEAQEVLDLQDYEDKGYQTQRFGEIEIREIFNETS